LTFDLVYLFSARSARKWLANKERDWGEAQFYYKQYHSRGASFGRWLVTILLWTSIFIPAALGLVVAKPLLPLCIAGYLPNIPNAAGATLGLSAF